MYNKCPFWSYGSWIYNYICNQFLSPLTWVRIPLRRGVLDTTLCDKVCRDLWQVSGFLPVLRFPPNNKTDPHDITEILLKVALSTITLTHPTIIITIFVHLKCKSAPSENRLYFYYHVYCVKMSKTSVFPNISNGVHCHVPVVHLPGTRRLLFVN
jgi:hypothetical protein